LRIEFLFLNFWNKNKKKRKEKNERAHQENTKQKVLSFVLFNLFVCYYFIVKERQRRRKQTFFSWVPLADGIETKTLKSKKKKKIESKKKKKKKKNKKKKKKKKIFGKNF